jgi:tripartite-type tricarboxylate transporter receptor subunit TctC
MYKYATKTDVERCLVCAKKFIEHYGFVWNEESVKTTLTLIIERGVVILKEINNVVIGAAGGMTTTNPWNHNEKIFQEMFWWVESEYRDTSVGIKLLKLLEKEAPKGATIALSILPTTNIKSETLLKLGYSLRELAYTRS